MRIETGTEYSHFTKKKRRKCASKRWNAHAGDFNRITDFVSRRK